MADWKCTTENDIINQYSNQFPSNLIKVQTLSSPNESSGQAGLFQVSTPYATNVQCPAGYQSTGKLNSDGSIVCEFVPPSGSNWGYSRFTGTITYTDPATGQIKTVPATQKGTGTINYMTFTQGGACTSPSGGWMPVGTSSAGTLTPSEQAMYNELNQYQRTHPSLTGMINAQKQMEQMGQFQTNISGTAYHTPFNIPEYHTISYIPEKQTINKIIPSETNPIIKSTIQTISQSISQPITKPISQHISQPITKPISQHISQPITKPISQPISIPKTQPSLTSKIKDTLTKYFYYIIAIIIIIIFVYVFAGMGKGKGGAGGT